MHHNKFDYTFDFIKPLHYFFQQHDLLLDEDDGEPLERNIRDKFNSVFGYSDERDLHFVHVKEY